MTTTVQQDSKGEPAKGKRIGRILAGIVLGLVSLGLVSAGGFAALVSSSDGGFVDLGHSEIRTDSYAVVSEPVDWESQKFLFWDISEVRLRVTPASGSAPTFIGLARPQDVEQYLAGVGYVTAKQAPAYKVTYVQHNGSAPSTPPTGASLWTVQASGTDTLTLQFTPQEQSGDRVLVGMNANGSPSLTGQVESNIKVPALPWVAAVSLIAGIVLLAGSVMLIVKARRR